MADNVVSNAGSGGATWATDDIAGVHHLKVKPEFGDSDSATQVSATNPFPVVQTGTPGLPTGAATETTLGTRLADATFTARLNTQGQKTMAASTPVVIASDQSAVLVSGTVTITPSGTQTVDSELTTADLDTGVGTDTRAVVGLVGSKSGGGQLIPGDATAGLKVDLGVDNDVTITSGTVTANAGTGTFTVDQANTATADYDTGAGTVNQEMIGIALPASGGPVAGGTAAAPIAIRLSSGAAFQNAAREDGNLLTLKSNINDVLQSVASNRLLVKADEQTVSEDTAAGTGQTGLAVFLAQRKDVAGSTVDADGDWSTLHVTSAGRLRVDNSEVTQPVSGTVSANLNAGTNNIGDVDVLTVPAPLSTTGGGTEAAALRVTVANDSTGLVAVKQATATNLKAEVVGPTADNAANPTAKLAILAGVANAAAPTRTEGNVVPLRTNLAGDVAVTLDGEIPAVTINTGSNVIGALTANQSVNVAQINGVAPTMGSGVTGTGVQRVNLATDVALPTGTNTIGNVGLATRTSGGATSATLISAASTNATSVKGSAGHLYGWAVFNNHATLARYFKLYNKATAPTVGTDTPVLTIMLPPLSGTNLDIPMGIAFGTGIAYALTALMAANDATIVGASEIAVNLWYA